MFPGAVWALGSAGRRLLSSGPFFPSPLLPSVSVAVWPAEAAACTGQGGGQASGAPARPFPSAGPPRGRGQLKPQEEETRNQELAPGSAGLSLSRSSAAPGSAAHAGNSCPKAQETAAAGTGSGVSRQWAGARQAIRERYTGPGRAGAAEGPGPAGRRLPGAPAGAALRTPCPCSGCWVEGPREGGSGKFLFQGWEGDPWHQASTWDTGSNEGFPSPGRVLYPWLHFSGTGPHLLPACGSSWPGSP